MQSFIVLVVGLTFSTTIIPAKSYVTYGSGQCQINVEQEHLTPEHQEAALAYVSQCQGAMS